MRNKRNFNNLFDSICVTILFFFELLFYFVILWFGVINSQEGTNPTALLIVSTIMFGGMAIITAALIIKFCYEYWILSNDSIVSKKLFSKRKTIKLAEIERVEKKTISALILGIYKNEAYIICSSTNQIAILIHKRKEYSELECAIAEFLSA